MESNAFSTVEVTVHKSKLDLRPRIFFDKNGNFRATKIRKT
jgi:hypothetical protein